MNIFTSLKNLIHPSDSHFSRSTTVKKINSRSKSANLNLQRFKLKRSRSARVTPSSNHGKKRQPSKSPPEKLKTAYKETIGMSRRGGDSPNLTRRSDSKNGEENVIANTNKRVVIEEFFSRPIKPRSAKKSWRVAIKPRKNASTKKNIRTSIDSADLSN